MNSTRQTIEELMQTFPLLNSYGMGLGSCWEKEPNKNAVFKENREILLNSELAFERSCEWFSFIKEGKSINYKHNSYGYKHMVDRYCRIIKDENTYIPTGSLIAAAIHLGFKHKIFPGTSDVYLNCEEFSIRRFNNMTYPTHTRKIRRITYEHKNQRDRFETESEN